MCNLGGNQYLLLAGIVLDHRKEESALDRADMYVQHGSNRHIRKQKRLEVVCRVERWQHIMGEAG